MADESAETSTTTQWHERTVERSLKAARQRAISRGDKFISAAAELLRSTGKPDFTVQEVVDRSGMSLRSFYHHFATKDDLLLALVEETVRRYIDALRPSVDAVDDPIEKLEILLRSAFGSEATDDAASRGLVLFHWHLADARTDEFVATLQPQVEIISEIVQLGVDRKVFRTDISIAALATIVTNTLVSLLDMRVLGVHLTKDQVSADDLVKWCLAGVAAPHRKK